VNSIFLTGFLTKDVELRKTDNDIDYATFTLAFSDWRKTDNKTSFIPVVAWRKLALLCKEHIGKGVKVTVEGSISIRDYDDARGVRRYVTEVVAREVIFYPRQCGDERVLEREELCGIEDPAILCEDEIER
jgi:single stranded DNA-binding protein (ssb)